VQFKKIASDVAMSAGRVGLSLVRGILLIAIITKYVGVQAYGQWVTAAAILAITGAENLHLHGALVRYSNDETDAGQTLADILGLAGVMGTAAVGVIVIIGVTTSLVPVIDSSTGVPLYCAIATVVIAKAPLVVLLNYPRASGRVKRYELLRITRILSETTVVIVILLSTGDIVLALLGMAGLAAVFDGVLLVSYYPRRIVPSLSNARQYLAYSLPMVPTEFAKRLLSNADRYLLFVLISPTIAGVYAAAYAIPRLLVRLPDTLHATLYPSVTSAWDEDKVAGIELLYERIIRWYIVFALPSAVGLTMLAYPLLRHLATPAIAERGTILVPLLCAGFVVRGLAEIVVHVHYAAEATTTISSGYIAAVVVNIALLLFLIPRNGIFGAAVATVFAQFLLAFYLIERAQAHVLFSFPGATLLRTGIATVCMALVLHVMRVVIAPRFEIGVFPIVGAIVYFGTLFAIDGIPGSDKAIFG
jgi:O-antigen/teichoic acid export membrane protein